jgi:hypothetical protein
MNLQEVLSVASLSREVLLILSYRLHILILLYNKVPSLSLFVTKSLSLSLCFSLSLKVSQESSLLFRPRKDHTQLLPYSWKRADRERDVEVEIFEVEREKWISLRNRMILLLLELNLFP